MSLFYILYNISQALLDDTETYSISQNDNTIRIQTEMNEILQHIGRQQQIDRGVVYRCVSHNGVAPRLYALPKIHKDNTPMRPVVSFIKSPTYNSSRLICDILNNIVDKEKYYINNSYMFQEFVVNQRIPDGNILISLDVKSLFTNIPLKLVLEIVNEKWNQIKNFTKIVKTSFIKLLKICIKANYFVYEDIIYTQKFGMPMGSPLSPVLGDLVMERLLDTVIPKLSFNPVFLKKYVDDIITSVPLDKVDEILLIFNSFHERLQFTIEREVDNQIPFLDMELIRDGGSILTNWYTKPMSSGRILNYKSDHVHSQKINTASELIRRASSLSSPPYKNQALEKAKRLLLQNGYDDRIIRKLTLRFNSINNRTQFPAQSNSSASVTVSKFRSLAYFNGCSEQLAKTIKIYDPSIGIGFKSYNTLYSLFFSKLKQKVPKLLCSELIYKIDCGDCELSYVGHTKSYLKIRLGGHKSDVRAGNVDKCATAQHAIDEEHSLKFDDVSILGFSNNLQKRLVLEMLHIKRHGTMNRKTDTDHIRGSYTAIMEKIRDATT